MGDVEEFDDFEKRKRRLTLDAASKPVASRLLSLGVLVGEIILDRLNQNCKPQLSMRIVKGFIERKGNEIKIRVVFDFNRRFCCRVTVEILELPALAVPALGIFTNLDRFFPRTEVAEVIDATIPCDSCPKLLASLVVVYSIAQCLVRLP